MEHSEAYEAGRAVGQIVGGLMALVFGLGGFGFFIFALVKACTRKTKGWIATTVVLGVVGLAFVGLVAFGFATGVVAAIKASKKDKVLTSQDGRYSISVPGTWKTIPELNEEAVIEGGSRTADRYAIVIVADKKDFEMTLDEYAKVIAAQLKEATDDPDPLKPESIAAGAFPAVRYRISGTVDNVNITYHATCVETPTEICQVMCWSLKSDEKAAEPVFDKVTRSFVAKAE